MNLLTGLFRAARKRLMTTDNDMGMFRTKLDELVAGKDTLSDEDINAKVEELKGFTKDLPGDDDKAKLDRFLEDFKSVKEQDPAAAKEAASMVADLFEKLDTAAMQDVPATEEPAAEPPAEEPAVEETTTEELVEGAAPAAEEEDAAPEAESTEEVVEKTVAPEGEEAKDADPAAEYTAEELYQFMKKRMLEDEEVLQFLKQRMAEDAAACQDGAEEVQEGEKEEEVVTDHAMPFIPVTINGNKANGSLGSMFAEIKNGGR